MPDPKYPVPLRQLPAKPGRVIVNVAALPPVYYAVERLDNGTFDVALDAPAK